MSADEHSLNLSPEDVEVHVELSSGATHPNSAAEHSNGDALQMAQKRALDVQSALESLKKGT